MSGILTAFIGRVAGVVTDAYFNLVTLLLPGNGTNGAQNNTFLDSSTNNFTITRNGNTTQGTFSPFSQTGWSVYLNGSSSFLVPAGLQTAFAGWGGRTRSWESFIFRVDSNNYNLQSAYAGVAANGRWYISIVSNKLEFGWTTSTGTQTSVVSTATIPLGWSHLTVCVDSTTSANTTIYLGINGVVQAFTGNNLSTQTSTYTWNGIYATGQFLSPALTGYSAGLRWSDNIRYSSNYTVPTASFSNDANTLFLFAQSNRFLDQSSNNYTIAIEAGAPAIQPFSPFLPTIPYSTLVVGGSGYFDGTGDYINTPTSAAVLGTNNWTFECWVYLNAKPAFGQVLGMRQSSSTNAFVPVVIAIDATGFAFYSSDNGSSWNINNATAFGGTAVINQWYHVAVVRNGSTITGYVNGAATTLKTSVTSNYTSTSGVYVGASTTGDAVNCYVSSARVVNGSAVYTAAFTPPTAPLTAIANTAILLNFTNAGIIDASSDNVFETGGNAQISTAQSKFGGSSILFDGTDDFLSAPYSPLFNFGTGQFTIECWVNFTTLSGNRLIFDTYTAASLGGGYQLFWRSTGTSIAFYANGVVVAQSSFTAHSTNVWYHVAVTRDASNVLRIFIDGTQYASATYATAINMATTGKVAVGIQVSTLTNDLAGYINDLRVTNGLARYTANFTPPTAAFPLQ